MTGDLFKLNLGVQGLRARMYALRLTARVERRCVGHYAGAPSAHQVLPAGDLLTQCKMAPTVQLGLSALVGSTSRCPEGATDDPHRFHRDRFCTTS